MTSHGVSSADYEKALNVGRPPNVVKLFPNSKALLVSGKVIDRAMIKKGKAMAIAASVRNSFVAYGALRAAQRANAAIIIEIAKSEGLISEKTDLLPHNEQGLKSLFYSCPGTRHYGDFVFNVILTLQDMLLPRAKTFLRRNRGKKWIQK
ncbi:MAG: fructose-bisphosphate aldolase, class [Thermodesulfobacteriota bacterium]|nr:fructose-bisphosphate aldolase, class [Thermodesulfobacteriota bacterium]